jgi:hypothetical protein
LNKVLEKASDYAQFRERIIDWSKKNPDRWIEISSRLDYCKDLLQRGQLGTDIDISDPDIRWRLFIENGAPENQLTFSGRYNPVDTACKVWTLVWPSASSGQRGLEISCWSRSGQHYPTEIIPGDDNDFPLAFPIWPFVNYSKFPSSDGTIDLWFSVWVPGDQFTRLTLDSGQLSIRIDLYDSSKTVLVASSEELSNLQIIRGILEAVDSQDRGLIRAMGYIGFSQIKPGKYNAHLTILGGPDNEGQNWMQVIVPEDTKISDLLVLEQSMATGDNVLPGILRGSMANLYDNPECRLAPNAKFGLYLETTLPSEHSKRFEAWATLRPIPEVPIWMSASITTGRPIVVADSLGRPFTKGEWQSSRDQKLLEEMASSEFDAKSTKIMTLLKKKFDAPKEGAAVVKFAPRLESDLRSGRYLLTVTISDPERQSYFLSARRVIRVISSSLSAR